jgi:hypothetical protein
MKTIDNRGVDAAIEALRDCYFWRLDGKEETDFRTLEATQKTIRDLGDAMLADLDNQWDQLEPAKVIVENLLRFLNDHPRRQVVKSTDFAEDTAEWSILRALEDGRSGAGAPSMAEFRVFTHLEWPDRVIDRSRLMRALSFMYGHLGLVMGGRSALLVLSRLVRADELVEA